ncbi:MAG: coproporphyrinogen III oxidase, partial [Firmicutes bacterium]|nr:coproporphyrinogen III oxidase [Bacillota bacterium]
AELSPEHISAYSLIIEEGTPFYEMYGGESLEKFNGAWHHKEILKLPDEDSEREMYLRTEEILETYGYHRYEISNYAKPGKECRHNLTYWTMGDYLGLGLGAAGKIGSRRLQNTEDLNLYMQRFEETETEILTVKNQMEEMMFLGLRLTEGVSLDVFEETFGYSLRSVYGEVIRRWTGAGCLEISGAGRKYLRLTKKGMDIANQVMADFLLEDEA